MLHINNMNIIQQMTTYRYKVIENYLRTNENFKEHDLHELFPLSEECYKHIHNVIINKNTHAIENSNLNDNDIYNCAHFIFSYYAIQKEHNKALDMLDICYKHTDHNAKKLIVRYHKYKIKNADNNIEITDYEDIIKDDYVSKNEGDDILQELITIFKSKNNHEVYEAYEAYDALMSVYNVKNENKKSRLLLSKYALENKCYNTLSEMKKINRIILYLETVDCKDYRYMVERQLDNDNIMVKYWNLAHIEMYYNTNINNKKIYETIHTVNYFYELFSQQYDDCILNYNNNKASDNIKIAFFDTIYHSSNYVLLNDNSRELLKMSKYEVSDVLKCLDTYSNKKKFKTIESVIKKVHVIPIDKNDYEKNRLETILDAIGFSNRKYVDNCCICLDYVIVHKIKNCMHCICFDCRKLLKENICPLCRNDINVITE